MKWHSLSCFGAEAPHNYRMHRLLQHTTTRRTITTTITPTVTTRTASIPFKTSSTNDHQNNNLKHSNTDHKSHDKKRHPTKCASKKECTNRPSTQAIDCGRSPQIIVYIKACVSEISIQFLHLSLHRISDWGGILSDNMIFQNPPAGVFSSRIHLNEP